MTSAGSGSPPVSVSSTVVSDHVDPDDDTPKEACGVFGVYAPGNGAWVDEGWPLAPATTSGRTRLAAERALPPDAVILRAAGIHGPGRGLVERIRSGTYRIIGDGRATRRPPRTRRLQFRRPIHSAATTHTFRIIPKRCQQAVGQLLTRQNCPLTAECGGLDRQ